MMSEIRRLAILNRGEPAMRLLAAVAELNGLGDRPPITTVALYTDPDADARYVHRADEALSLGSPTYVDAVSGDRRCRYLDEDLVMRLLGEAGVDAVWVGWGSPDHPWSPDAEQPQPWSFAERCERAGITFVGPDSAT